MRERRGGLGQLYCMRGVLEGGPGGTRDVRRRTAWTKQASRVTWEKGEACLNNQMLGGKGL